MHIRSLSFVAFTVVFVGLRSLAADASAPVLSDSAARLTEKESPARRLSLDGTWAFTIDAAKLDRPAAEWDHLPVPGNWDTVDAYSQHVGRGWYRREFTPPAAWRGARVRLTFDAVYETAEVTLNGEPLGRHEGGYTPFEFDVTSRLRWDAPNILTVVADNTYRRGAWWAWGGISRSVALVAHADTRLVWQHVRAEPDLAAGTARVFVDYLVENAGDAPATVDLAGEISFATAIIAPVSARVTVGARATQRVTAEVTLPRAAVHLWHFDHPHLYTLTTTPRVGDATQPAQRDRFGVRQIAVKPDGLYLNGERVRLVGFNRVHDHRVYGNTEPDHLVRLDVDLMKRYGGNFMRIMHAPSAPNLLDYLDEKGVLIFAEIPVWGQGDPNMIPENPRTKRWLDEMIARDFNHPSIIGWSVGNELLNHDAYVRSMLAHVRALDPHRLASYVSLSGARPQYTPQNDPITASDLILHNTYGTNPGSLVDTLAEKWPGRPVFLSEFGGHQLGETLDSRIPGLDERWQSLTGRDQVIGASLWTFSDYRSNFPGSAPGELRSWGIVDLWRQPKDAARDIARLHSPIRDLRAVGDTARLTPRGADEFPSYTLRGYQLVWEWRRADRTTVAGGVIALPDLAPGAPAFEYRLTGRPAAFAALVLTVVSPTGYVVHEFSTAQTAETPAPPLATSTSAPLIARAYPFDGGFMLGHSQQPDDTAFRIEYGAARGQLTQSAVSTMKGVLSVRGLENGKTYFFRLRREPAGRAPGDWSAEIAVTPDGGLVPAAPRLLGVVQSADLTAVRFAPVEKATGYRVRWGASDAEMVLLNAAVPGPVVLRDLAVGVLPAITVTALNAYGESVSSAPLPR
jgi:beta-galactosidase